MKTTLPKDLEPQSATELATIEALREYYKKHTDCTPKSELLKLIKDSKPEVRIPLEEVGSMSAEELSAHAHGANKHIDLFEQNLLNKLEEK
jgi:hypothetical protein